MSLSQHQLDHKTQAIVDALFGNRPAANGNDTGTTLDPDLQRRVMSAAEHIQRQHDGRIDSARLMRAADIALANGVQHESPEVAIVRTGDKSHRIEAGSCPCSDAHYRDVLCKHALAVMIDRRAAGMLAPDTDTDTDAAPDAVEPSPRGHWSEHEPNFVHSLKFRDRELDIEHLCVVRADTLPELWASVAQVTAMIKAKRARPETAGTPAVDEVPVCHLHGVMRPSTKAPGTFYCAAKLADSSFCRERGQTTKS